MVLSTQLWVYCLSIYAMVLCFCVLEGPMTKEDQITIMQLSLLNWESMFCMSSVTLLIDNTWYELIFKKIMSHHCHLCYY